MRDQKRLLSKTKMTKKPCWWFRFVEDGWGRLRLVVGDWGWLKVVL